WIRRPARRALAGASPIICAPPSRKLSRAVRRPPVRVVARHARSTTHPATEARSSNHQATIRGQTMHPRSIRRGLIAATAIVAAGLFAAAAPTAGRAAGALAIALPPDVAKGGFSYGYANDKSDPDTASSRALELCRTTKDASTDAKLRNLCKVILNYSDKC